MPGHVALSRCGVADCRCAVRRAGVRPGAGPPILSKVMCCEPQFTNQFTNRLEKSNPGRGFLGDFWGFLGISGDFWGFRVGGYSGFGAGWR